MNTLLVLVLSASALVRAQTGGSSTTPREQPVVPTPLGSIRGSEERSANGRLFMAFRGIPYARPPVGQLRFMPPRPVEPWSNVRDGTTEGSSCPHYDPFQNEEMVGAEDCLYLNVYTPRVCQRREGGRQPPSIPVMVFFHGGAFIWGSGSSKYYGAKYLLDHDILLVTVNSRLGPLGYLSTGDHVVQGNMGLKDQVEALKWVQKYIAYFGGDPTNVTIVGHVAGGSSVHYHMLSPMSKGLFHRAISQSATALSPIAYVVNPRLQATKMALLLNCSWKSSHDLLDCLQKVSFQDILQQYSAYNEWYVAPFSSFAPSLEKEGPDRFLSEDPFSLLRKNQIARVPWMVGNTAKDGAVDMIGLINNTQLLQELDQNSQRLFPLSFYYRDRTSDPDAITREVRKVYFGKNPINNNALDAIINLYSDRLYDFSTYHAARMHATTGAPVYFYRLTYEGQETFVKSFWGVDANIRPSLHDDMLYLFNMDIAPEFKQGSNDRKMVEIMTTLWANFVKYGDPTPCGEFETLLQWEPLEANCMKYMNLNLDLGMKEDFAHQRMKFWRSLPLLENFQEAQCRPTTKMDDRRHRRPAH